MILVAFVVPQLLIKRAVPSVIKLLREHEALSEDKARSMEELGLVRKMFSMQRLGTRDYRPKAMQLLQQLEVVKADLGGNVYLDETQLAKTIWHHL